VGDCISDEDLEDGQVIDLGTFSVSNSGSSQLCAGDNTMLSVNAAAGHTYQWMRNNVDIAGQTANTLNATQEGAYRVRVSFGGCSVETAETNVTILSKPVAGFTAITNACIGEEILFNNTSTVDIRATLQYNWNFDDGQTSSDATDVTHSYSVVGQVSPVLTISYSGLNSCTDSHMVSISISDASPPVISADVTEMCSQENVMLSIEGDYKTITWNTNESSSFIIVTQPNIYSVLTEDANGCIGTDEIVISERSDCGGLAIEIPKMFSPNDDTRNDRWIITGIENYTECTMKIFDDKGVGIFQQTGYPQEGWDGLQKNGKPAPDGVYYYILACPDKTPVTGAVTILR
jgi:gliding motility-associated-like protein